MVEYPNIGSACNLDEKAFDLGGRVVELNSLGAIEEACKVCGAVGILEAYMRYDDHLSTRRVLAFATVVETLSKVCAKGLSLPGLNYVTLVKKSEPRSCGWKQERLALWR